MNVIRRKCAQKALPEIRDNYNTWYGSKLWAPNFPGNRTWFEDVDRKLFCAFQLTVSGQRPKAPAKPAPLVGGTTAALGAELLKVSTSLMKYGTAMLAYAKVVNAASGIECRDKTRALLDLIDREEDKLTKSLPKVTGNDVQLCQAFTKWSKQFHVLSEAFAKWEDVMDKCLDNRHPDCASDDGLVPAGILQVSPVPWPPWQDYADE